MSFEEEERFATILGGRRDPLHGVCHVWGEAIRDVGKPKRDVRDTDIGPEGDFLGYLLLWGKQDEGHPLGERRERIVEDPSPLVVVLQDVAHEDPGDSATVLDEVDNLGTARRGSPINATVSLWLDQGAQPGRPADPSLRSCTIGKPGSADFVACRFPIRPRLLKALIPGSPLANVRHHNTSRSVAAVLAAGYNPQIRRAEGNLPPHVYGGVRLYHERLGIATALFTALPRFL